MRRDVIVADIDGCCIFSEKRLPFMLSGDIESWDKNHHSDEPIPQGVVVYRKFLMDPTYRFYFVTGRPASSLQTTLKQLRSFVSPTIAESQLLMRPDGLTADHMHDTELKPYLLGLAGISFKEVFMVFEDRSSVVSMWRSNGVVCYQTAWGDF